MVETSTLHGNKKFKFKLDVINELDIPPVYSNSFFVVYYMNNNHNITRKYQLALKYPVPSIWYKDEGGKRNNITLEIVLAVQSKVVYKK